MKARWRILAMFAGLMIAVPVLGSTVSAAEEAEEDDGGGDLSQ